MDLKQTFKHLAAVGAASAALFAPAILGNIAPMASASSTAQSHVTYETKVAHPRKDSVNEYQGNKNFWRYKVNHNWYQKGRYYHGKENVFKKNHKNDKVKSYRGHKNFWKVGRNAKWYQKGRYYGRRDTKKSVFSKNHKKDTVKHYKGHKNFWKYGRNKKWYQKSRYFGKRDAKKSVFRKNHKKDRVRGYKGHKNFWRYGKNKKWYRKSSYYHKGDLHKYFSKNHKKDSVKHYKGHKDFWKYGRNKKWYRKSSYYSKRDLHKYFSKNHKKDRVHSYKGHKDFWKYGKNKKWYQKSRYYGKRDAKKSVFNKNHKKDKVSHYSNSSNIKRYNKYFTHNKKKDTVKMLKPSNSYDLFGNSSKTDQPVSHSRFSIKPTHFNTNLFMDKTDEGSGTDSIANNDVGNEVEWAKDGTHGFAKSGKKHHKKFNYSDYDIPSDAQIAEDRAKMPTEFTTAKQQERYDHTPKIFYYTPRNPNIESQLATAYATYYDGPSNKSYYDLMGSKDVIVTKVPSSILTGSAK